MPALGVLLAWFASFLISSIIVRVFVMTGLSLVTFYFVNDLVDTAQTHIQNAFYGLPSDAIAFIRLYKLDQAVSIILSALSIAAYIKTAKVFVGRS